MQATADQLVITLSAVARDGAIRAGRGLSGLMGQKIAIHVPHVRMGTKADACDAVGGRRASSSGRTSGSAGYHRSCDAAFPVARALECVDLMCGQPPGTTTEPDDLARSAIGELGNIVGSAFVNALADRVNLILHPSPPTIVHDMAIALVETVYAEVLSQGGDVAMIDTEFEDHKGRSAGFS